MFGLCLDQFGRYDVDFFQMQGQLLYSACKRNCMTITLQITNARQMLYGEKRRRDV